MSKIIFLKEPEKIYDGTFFQIGKNQVRLIFTSEVPKKETLTSGFNLVNEHNGRIQTKRTDYIYIYRTYEDNSSMIELCNNNIPWIESEFTVKFNVDFGGTLIGETSQKVKNYEDLVVPTIQTEEGYEFVGWTPEIPTKGKLEKDVVFRAIVIDKNVYFYANEGGSLDGEIKQAVNDYSELVIPTPVADDNCVFVRWEPEIPTEGEIVNGNNCFFAVFEDGTSDRLNALENDLTDTQIGLVENYDLSLGMAEEITDLQLALVEIYDLLMGGM